MRGVFVSLLFLLFLSPFLRLISLITAQERREGKEGLIVIVGVEGHGKIPICYKKLRYAAFLALRVFRS